MYKVGFGFDSHKFKEGNFIILGGVKIDHYRSIEAHSDGDLIIHALSDALLGAAGLGDLGGYFQGSEKDKDISGAAILSKILEKINLGLENNNLASSYDTNQIDLGEIEDSINSFDSYRLQVNQSIIDLREKLNNLELKILDSQNE